MSAPVTKTQWHECFFFNSSQIRQGLRGLRAFFCLQKVSSPARGLDMLQGLCIEIDLSAELHLAVIKQRISVSRLPSPSLFVGAIKTHWQKHARNFHSSSFYIDIAKREKIPVRLCSKNGMMAAGDGDHVDKNVDWIESYCTIFPKVLWEQE